MEYNNDLGYKFLKFFLWSIFLWASIIHIPCRTKRLSWLEPYDCVY